MFGINQQNNNQMNKSEYRKIQFTGGSTYTVSLPKKWVVDNNLSSSDMVNITHLNDGNLQISPYESNSIKTVIELKINCLLYTSPSPRDRQKSRMPSSA